MRKAQSKLNQSTSKGTSLARSKGNQSLIDQLHQIAAGKGGGGGGFSLNPLDIAGEAVGALGSGISKVLETADIPRSYVASGVNQVANSLDDVFHGDGPGFDLGQLQADASAHKGVGTYLQEQLQKEANRGDGRHADIFGIPIDVKDPNAAQSWLQRGVGLAGDIATDPLTYIGTGLVDEGGKLATGGLEHLGRTKAAEVLAAGGRATDAEIARVGKFGLGAVGERAGELGLKPTMTLAGFPLPATEGIAQGLRNVTGVTRAALGEGRLGEAIRRIRTPAEERALTEAVVGGGAGAADAARALAAKTSERAVGRSFGDAQRDGLHAVLQDAKTSGAKSEDIIRALEESPAALPPEAQPVADWLKGVREAAIRQGADVKEIAGYAPHQLTNKARRILARSGDVPLVAGEAKFGPELLRGFKAGETFLGHTLETGSLDEMNRVFQAAKGVPLFETDLNKILPKYLAGLQGVVGKAAGGARMTELGIGRPIEQVVTKGAQSGTVGSPDVIAQLGEHLKSVKSDAAVAGVESKAAFQASGDAAERALRAIPVDHPATLFYHGSTEGLAGGSPQLQAGGLFTTTSADQAAEYAARKGGSGTVHAFEAKGANLLDPAAPAPDALLSAIGDVAGVEIPAGSSTSGALDQFNRSFSNYDQWAEKSTDLAERLSQAGIHGVQYPAEGGATTAHFFDPKVLEAKQAARDIAKMAPVVDPAAVATHAVETGTVAPQVAATHSAIDAVLATKPKNPADYVAMRDWMDSVDEILTHYGSADDPNVRLVANLFAQGEAAATKATLAKQTVMSSERMLKMLREPTYHTSIADVIDDGFKKIGGTRYAQPHWLADAAETSSRIRSPKQWQGFIDAYDYFTQLWKGYATLSPGFHFRNAYGGVLNNWIAKVDSKGVYGDFHDLWQAAKKGTLTPEQELEWAHVSAVTNATGGGLFANELETAVTKQGRFNPASKNFGLFQRSQKAGNFVEGHLRGTMALDSLRKGQGLEEAVARVEKFHFNYADISDFDRAAKKIIPFWMFTSRNLPLQVEMMLRRPGIYTKYAALKRSMELGTTPEAIVPSYFDEGGAIHTDLTLPGAEGDAYFSPDLPFLRLTSDAAKFDDPSRAISDMNPLVKLPLELLAGKKLYNDQPFKTGPQELPGSWGPLNNLLEAVGLAERGQDGKLYSSDQTSYGVENLVPLLGRLRRLVPTEQAYKERWGSSVAGFLGGPFKVNTPSAQAGELATRQGLIDDLIAHQRSLGKLPKTKAQARADAAKKKGS